MGEGVGHEGHEEIFQHNGIVPHLDYGGDYMAVL